MYSHTRPFLSPTRQAGEEEGGREDGAANQDGAQGEEGSLSRRRQAL